MEIAMFLRGGSRAGRRRRGCRALSRNRTSRMRVWRGCRRARWRILPTWLYRFPRCSGSFVNDDRWKKRVCTNLEVLRILLIVDYFGDALHSFDANDTFER